ncbi:hypothetical protein [Weissella confusa]|uniref:hypothetical protein n=1 Tax=Weissella confusa TaxID=1583 RepID=UPI00107F7AC5|nr:hypothetical protein [Weissella confusa]TGE71955.1 hypothetical protein C6P10_10860 [Weissella confusa]
MLLIAAVLVLSIIGFGIVAVCTAPPERRSRVALRIVDVLAELLNPFAIRRLVNNRGHPKNCKEKPANQKFGSRD